MKRHLGVAVVAFTFLVCEGVFFSRLPYSLSGLLFLPILHVPKRQHRLGWLLTLVLYESMVERMPILAGLSMIVMIEALLELMEGEFDIRSLAFSACILPGIDLARQFWTAIFVSLYDLPAPPPVAIGQLLAGATLGLAYHVLIGPHLWRERQESWA